MGDRPHILLVTADQWSGNLLGTAGHACVQTPTLDALAQSGRRYCRAYSETPTCGIARKNLMTGRASGADGPGQSAALLAETFRRNGYQTHAVGALCAVPKRSRLGFDDVLLCEETRSTGGFVDDYEAYLAARGYAGMRYVHGMGDGQYATRPWHLPEEMHATNWATREMVRAIQRRDPTRPGLWHLSYTHPRPPLVPLESYVRMYYELPVGIPSVGEWAEDPAVVPAALRVRRESGEHIPDYATRVARRALYALCTHIDHQLRVVLGTLREQNMLDNTIILFSADHGDMLGKHGLWSDGLYYEEAACVPMLLVGTGSDDIGHGILDDRLVGWQDIMPTLLQVAGIPVPDSVRGISMLGAERRDYLYGEIECGKEAIRMVHDGRFKLIYYAAGNGVQIFDLEEDPEELVDVAAQLEGKPVRQRLEQLLIEHLRDEDREWVDAGVLIGI